MVPSSLNSLPSEQPAEPPSPLMPSRRLARSPPVTQLEQSGGCYPQSPAVTAGVSVVRAHAATSIADTATNTVREATPGTNIVAADDTAYRPNNCCLKESLPGLCARPRSSPIVEYAQKY